MLFRIDLTYGSVTEGSAQASPTAAIRSNRGRLTGSPPCSVRPGRPDPRADRQVSFQKKSPTIGQPGQTRFKPARVSCSSRQPSGIELPIRRSKIIKGRIMPATRTDSENWECCLPVSSAPAPPQFRPDATAMGTHFALDHSTLFDFRSIALCRRYQA